MKVELLSITPNAQLLIEKAARTCYDSGNKTRKRTYKKLIKHCIKKGHESIIEHASATFRIAEVSRALTHQLVRHRLASFSQRSQRYVDENEFQFITPPSIGIPGFSLGALDLYLNFMEDCQSTYRELVYLKVPKEDARMVLPNACTSEIVISANLREWRHILTLRTSKHAQWEIREVCLEILSTLKDEVPEIFFDFTVNKNGTAIRETFKHGSWSGYAYEEIS